MSLIKKLLKRLYLWVLSPILEPLRIQADLLSSLNWHERKSSLPNPLNRHGQKFFSQNDEDGITLEILRRIGIGQGVFMEFGVGNGLENNTAILLAHGWKGVWVGGEDLAFSPPPRGPLHFCQAWITRDNAVVQASSGLSSIGEKRIDVLSIDLDGNDLYIAQALLADGHRPELLIVEYNAKFPLPCEWSIAYSDQHQWDKTDYFGASLGAFIRLLKPFGYSLVCCNLTGANAFFVREANMKLFTDVPTDPQLIFQIARYHTFVSLGHPTSPQTLLQILQRSASSLDSTS